MVDCTFGGGNHSIPLLEKHPDLRILGLDWDESMITNAQKNFQSLITQKRLALEHSNYASLNSLDPRSSFKKKVGIKTRYDVVLMDLGFSSYQLEVGDRGFSYMGKDEQPLDMRYDQSGDTGENITAKDIINNSSEMELGDILNKFGDVSSHQTLAKKLIEARQGRIISTTGELK